MQRSLKTSDFIPNKGDIVWVFLDPLFGHEQSGRRPVLVLSPKELADHTNLIVICPIAKKIIGLPYEVVLKGTETQGAVLPFQIRSMDFKQHKAKFIEKAPDNITDAIIRSVGLMLSPR